LRFVNGMAQGQAVRGGFGGARSTRKGFFNDYTKGERGGEGRPQTRRRPWKRREDVGDKSQGILSAHLEEPARRVRYQRRRKKRHIEFCNPGTDPTIMLSTKGRLNPLAPGKGEGGGGKEGGPEIEKFFHTGIGTGKFHEGSCLRVYGKEGLGNELAADSASFLPGIKMLTDFFTSERGRGKEKEKERAAALFRLFAAKVGQESAHRSGGIAQRNATCFERGRGKRKAR